MKFILGKKKAIFLSDCLCMIIFSRNNFCLMFLAI